MDPYHIGTGSHELSDWDLQHHLSPEDAAVSASDILEGLLSGAHGVTREHAEYALVANGWGHAADGTVLHDACHVLDTLGVPHHHVNGATVEQVLGQLQDGHQVMMEMPRDHAGHGSALDELFQSMGHHEDGGGAPLAHCASRAVAVKGVDRSDPAHPQILLSDPRHADAPTVAYPLDAFSQAMKDSDFSFISTPAAGVDAGTPHAHAPTLAPGEPHKDHALLDQLPGNVTGLVTSALMLYATGMPGLSEAAGKVVEELTDSAWNSLMKSA